MMTQADVAVVPLFVECFMCDERRAHRDTRVPYCVCGWGQPGDLCPKCGNQKKDDESASGGLGYACRRCHEDLCLEATDDAS